MDDRKNVQLAALLIEKDQELQEVELIATGDRDFEKLQQVSSKRWIISEALEKLF